MNILHRIVSIVGFISMLVISASSVGVMAATDLNQNVLPVSQENNNKKAEVDVQIKSTKKSNGVSATATCDADLCARVGDKIEFGIECGFPDPRVVVTCVLRSAPPGTSFSVGNGNPVTGTVLWTARSPGTFDFTFQAVIVSCPADLICNPSGVGTFTVKVTHQSQEEREKAQGQLPDPSACDVTISPECSAALNECTRLLGDASAAECQEKYPYLSRALEEMIQKKDPAKVCADTFSDACGQANRECSLLIDDAVVCNTTYPVKSKQSDFLKKFPPSICEDALEMTFCSYARRQCDLLYDLAFCQANYPQFSTPDAVFIRIDPNNDACDDTSSLTCKSAQERCIQWNPDDVRWKATCISEFPYTP